MTKPRTSHATRVTRRPSRWFLTACKVALLALLPMPVLAQRAPITGIRTIVTSPADAQVNLRGSSELTATSPVELEPLWTGRYAVTITAPGYAPARGVLMLPETGETPYALSQPPGLSAGLFLRSLNFPGVPQLFDDRKARGAALLVAATGGLGAAIRDHIEYKDNFDQPDFESQDKAQGFRYARDRWLIYTGAVWGMSAVDHLVRARMDLIQASPTKVTLGAPKLTRGSVLWRSALVPGAGQDYANRRGRGLFWLGATLAAGAAYFVALESHNRIEIKLARAQALLATASPSEVAIRQEDVDHFTSREDDSQKLVESLALSTGIIYAANLIDAGIVPLQAGSSASKAFSLSAPVGARRAAIAFTHRF
jgi:hypothetical protein